MHRQTLVLMLSMLSFLWKESNLHFNRYERCVLTVKLRKKYFALNGIEPLFFAYQANTLTVKLQENFFVNFVQQQIPLPLPCYDFTPVTDQQLNLYCL